MEAEIEEDWKTATNLYGEKTAKRLEKITPTFPFLLYDISFMSLVDEGRSRKEVRNILDNYNEEDWAIELDGFTRLIKWVKEEHRKEDLEEQSLADSLNSFRKM